MSESALRHNLQIVSTYTESFKPTPVESECTAPLPDNAAPLGMLYRFHESSACKCVFLEIYYIYKRTAKGVWIADWGKNRFVLSDATKRFAYPTREEARVSFIKRKKRQLAILLSSVALVEEVLRIARNIEVGV